MYTCKQILAMEITTHRSEKQMRRDYNMRPGSAESRAATTRLMNEFASGRMLRMPPNAMIKLILSTPQSRRVGINFINASRKSKNQRIIIDIQIINTSQESSTHRKKSSTHRSQFNPLWFNNLKRDLEHLKNKVGGLIKTNKELVETNQQLVRQLKHQNNREPIAEIEYGRIFLPSRTRSPIESSSINPINNNYD